VRCREARLAQGDDQQADLIRHGPGAGSGSGRIEQYGLDRPVGALDGAKRESAVLDCDVFVPCLAVELGSGQERVAAGNQFFPLG